MAGYFAPDRVEIWMDEIEALDKFIGLCVSNPYAVSDPLTVEVEGGTYARVPTVWTRTAYNVMTLTSGIVVRGLPPGAVVGAVVVWSSEFTSGLVCADLLAAPVSYPSGGTYVIPASDFVMGIDIA